MKKLIEKLKTKWDITSDLDFFLIMLVFSLAGMGVSILRRPIFAHLGLSHSPIAIRILVSLLLIVPLYQFSTLAFALPLGQFQFFFTRQKKLVKFLGRSISQKFQKDQKI